MSKINRRRDEPQTNVEFLVALCEVSNHGPLAQLFVMDALEKWSAIIKDTDPKEVDTAFMNGKAWVSVAREIHDKITARHACLAAER